MLVPVTTVRQGTPSVAGDSAPVLAADASVGAVAITLNVVPTGLTVGSVVAIDAYTTECELRSVVSVAGNTVTVTALRYAHSSGDAIKILDGWVIPAVFGLAGNGSNEWAPLQRFFYEAVALGLHVDGRGTRFDIGQPLLIGTSAYTKDVYVRTHSSFTPIDNADATYSDNACVLVGVRVGFFSAAASTNTFTTASSHGFGDNVGIVFNNPYGETLPGGIVSGRWYWVKSHGSNTFTISATNGGAELDVTSDGTGMYLQSVATLTRIHWESFRIDLTVADVNGLITGLQQPSWSRNMRIEMTAVCTKETVGWNNSGQLSYHENVEINPAINCVGLDLSGVGHIFRGLNANGAGQLARITGDNNAIYDPWTEQCSPCGIEISATARGLVVGGTWLAVPPDDTTPILLVSSSSSSYELGMIRCHADNLIVIDDTARGWQIKSAGSSDASDDGAHVFGGLRQPYGVTAPFLVDRGYGFGISSDGTAGRQTMMFSANATGAPRTINLLTAVGWQGHMVMAHNGSTSGSNLVTIDPAGTETIDGVSTMTLIVGESVTLMSDGANWITVGRNIPGTIQTYAATNVSTDRSFDADTVAIAELADVVGTLIADLRARKIVG